jgi:hypothetical protein
MFVSEAFWTGNPKGKNGRHLPSVRLSMERTEKFKRRYRVSARTLGYKGFQSECERDFQRTVASQWHKVLEDSKTS